MMFFGMLVGLALLALPVFVVLLLIRSNALAKRVSALEERLGAAPQTVSETPGVKAGTPAKARPAKPAAGKSVPAKPAAAAARSGTAGSKTVTAPAAPPASAPPRLPGGPVRLAGWLRENWVYAVSALSLALAGVFLVQYGIERGLLSPPVRVLLALGLGLALIAAGETIRKRWGDGTGSSTEHLPSTFSAAGIVVLYAAILAARGLYGLIGPELAFLGLAAVSVVALVFGWFYGPFLAAAGILGAAAAPFLVEAAIGTGTLHYILFSLIAATALAIDAMRRWGWVAILGLGLAYTLGLLVHGWGGGFAGLAALMVWLALAAIALPRLEFWPSHPGPAILEMLWAARSGRKPAPAIPPTWIAAGAVLASCLILLVARTDLGAAESFLAADALTFLLLALTLWTPRARGLVDLALIPALGLLAFLFLEAAGFGALYAEIWRFDPTANPEAAPPMTVTLLLALATLGSCAAAWRSFRGPYPAHWAAGAALLAPVAAVIFELFWNPAAAIGGYFWAGHAIALAALMTLFAERFARADGDDRRRAAYAVLSALSLIALALFIILAKAALTVALGVLLAAAALLDRRFGLPEMRWFLIAGVATLGWRLVIDPGLPDYLGPAPLAEVVLAFGAALAGLAAARLALPTKARADGHALLESALWAYGGVFASVLLSRAIDAMIPDIVSFDPLGRPIFPDEVSHWSAALFGLTWTALALAQAYRIGTDAPLRWLRKILAALYGIAAAVAFGLTLTLLNPYLGLFDHVRGPQPADTLFVAYALPGLVFAAIAARAKWLTGHRAFGWLAGLFLAVYGFLAIRRFWQGDLSVALGFSQPELYSYTVALLILGAGLLYQAIARQSPLLRRLAMTVIALTVAKVFLIDAGGLTGLLRVFSFLALGLALAGLAWLNRWAAARLSGP